jgi:glyoxylase-like metal-dependent hydrolase (beta-lactamase superfamily II)
MHEGDGVPERPPMSSDPYDVFAVRYATRMASASQVFLNYSIYGESDRPMQMDYFFWIARNEADTIVFDTGFTDAVGTRRGRTMLCSPERALTRLGVTPTDVSTVVITHAHYDHTGNLGLFPNATVVIARREFDFWAGPVSQRSQFAHSAEVSDVDQIVALEGQGRVRLFDDQLDLTPGIELIEVGGHTPGQVIAMVHGRSGSVLLASDAAHYYEELDRDRPFFVVADLERMYRGFDLVKQLTTDRGAALVAGHDPDVLQRFPAVDPDDPGFAVQVG